MTGSRTTDPQPARTFEVVELRRYVTHSGKRDALIALFDREFTENQEACGMVPIGQFRNLDDPESFVWLRGFPQMQTRRRALERFYLESPAWQNHRSAANDTLADNDNVLLLRSARAASGFDLDGLTRRPSDAQPLAHQFVGVTVFMLEHSADEAFIDAFESATLPSLAGLAQRITYLVTDPRPNDFPALPVREGEFAFVVAGVCPNANALDAWSASLNLSELPTPMRAAIGGREMLRLAPTPRSLYGN